MTKEQVAAYLKRIGLEEDAVRGEKDADMLEKLIWAQLTHIPFEDMEVYDEDKVPSIEEEDIYHKIVEMNRGGYCFELNKLFYLFLDAAGFEVWPVAVRIIWQRPRTPAISHRATVVKIGEKKYLADVGYGGPGPKGSLELSDTVQQIRDGAFRVTVPKPGFWQVERTYQGEFSPMLYFEDRPMVENDSIPFNFYCARFETMLFRRLRIVNLCTEEGSKGIAGWEYTVKKGTEEVKRTIADEAEMRSVMLQEFGILYEGKLRTE